MKYIFISLLPIFSLDACEEARGNDFFKQGDYKKAFIFLRSCNEKIEMSGLSLSQLAVFFGYFREGTFENEKARKLEVSSLYRKSIKNGYFQSLDYFRDLFRNGDKDLNLKADENIEECLNEINDENSNIFARFESCLK